MIAAAVAAENGNEVILIEQNDKLGKKLFLTGKGRCNLTNACDTEELFQNIPRNPRFMYSAIYNFDNSRVMEYFEEQGLKLKIERGNRVFPASDHSSDVTAALVRKLKKENVKILLSERVVDITSDFIDGIDKVTGVILNDGSEYRCDAVILATGGNSYPTTGSDGTSFQMVKKMGIDVVEQSPSLVPFETNNEDVVSMQGLSLKNVTLSLYVNDKKVYEDFGEMLFTHFGISGPLVLTASTKLNNVDYSKKIEAVIDLKPALNMDELDKRVIKDFNQTQNKEIRNALVKLLPGKMIIPILNQAQINPEKRVNIISKEERLKLINTLKGYKISIIGNRGFREAIITRGGVNVKSINPSTMESKKIKGLYFAGEMIDVDAKTGGFNLQIAWSTGYLAGELIESKR